jgi:NAD(P)-dependent dehydrogenase (short-subunit alcohol dehydrogenase family)
MLWLKQLKPRLRKSSACTVTFFSARVGSISDNQRGGWYSYRSSKAALNMLLKSASIEFSHLNKNIKLLAFHPGTVDSFLSKPFHKMLAKGQLLQADDVAERLDNIISGLPMDGKLSYLDWKGEDIAF